MLALWLGLEAEERKAWFSGTLLSPKAWRPETRAANRVLQIASFSIVNAPQLRPTATYRCRNPTLRLPPRSIPYRYPGALPWVPYETVTGRNDSSPPPPNGQYFFDSPLAGLPERPPTPTSRIRAPRPGIQSPHESYSGKTAGWTGGDRA